MHPIITFAAQKLGVKLYPGQAEALEAYYASGAQNWLLLAGRRGGKSLLADIICCFEAVVPDFSAYLRPGEERYILIASVRADNAALHIRQVSKLLKHDKELRRMIERESSEQLQLKNGVTILSIPASARAGRGFTCSTVLLDELAFFVDSDGNSSAEAVYTALQPTIATFGEAGRVIITTSVNARTGIIYDLYERGSAGELEDFYVTRTDSRSLNPKVSERVINNALKRDEESARAEYFSEFREPVEAYLDAARVLEAVDSGLKEQHERQAERRYVMAVDPATQRDRYALVIMHAEGGAYLLDYARALKPPVDPRQAERLLVDLARIFEPVVIRCDTASTVQRLKDELAALEYTPFSRPFKLRIYGALKEGLNLGKVILYEHEELLEELKALQIRNGADIAAPKAGRVTHDDLADCLALCVEALASGADSESVRVMKNPFYQEGGLYDGGDPGEFHPVHGWVKSWNHKPHPEGITWRNCTHRNKGCFACEEELKAEGWYTELERQRAAEPMSEEEALKHFIECLPGGGAPAVEDPERQQARLTIRKIFNQVTRGSKNV